MKTPQIYIVRHGQTAWSVSGQHTGRSDIPLTATGEENARRVGRRLAGLQFSRVLCSPSSRARRTCELAGFGDRAVIVDDLAEWDYGQFEGLTTAEIQTRMPGWEIFRDGGLGGESPADVSARADRVVKLLRQSDEPTIVFSSGHFSRALAARWIGNPITLGRNLLLGTGSLSILGYEHSLSEPAIVQWNETPA